MNGFEIEIPREDVEFYRRIAQVSKYEGQAWMRIREALREYMIQFMDIDNPIDVDNLHSIFLPDLVDEIVEDIQSQYPDREKV